MNGNRTPGDGLPAQAKRVPLALRLLLWPLVIALRMCGPVAFWVATFVLLGLQAGPPAPPDARPPGPGPGNHIADIRQKLVLTHPVDLTAKRALEYSRTFLTTADSALRAGQPSRADRMAAAADSLLHVAEHQEHLRAGGSPKGPPPPDAIQDHLQRVYFRTQQADFFYSQSHDPRAASLPQWARDFYQLAVRASERKDFVAADENAKSSDEIVKALENLAQAANVPEKKRQGKTQP